MQIGVNAWDKRKLAVETSKEIIIWRNVERYHFLQTAPAYIRMVKPTLKPQTTSWSVVITERTSNNGGKTAMGKLG